MVRQCIALVLVWCCMATGTALAEGARQRSVPSMLVEVAGEACLGQERSRRQVEKLAYSDAKRAAAERAMTHVSSETSVENGALLADVVASYAKATVRVLEELEKGWYQSNPNGGFVDSCFRVKVKAEVVPAPVAAPSSAAAQNAAMSPRAPLAIELWTGKDTYRVGENMQFFFRGNKPFYAHAVYQDAAGNLIEVTPHARPRYYSGGVVYEIPGGEDAFTLRIIPPLGSEKLTLFASTQPMGGYEGHAADGLLVISRGAQPLDVATRGLAVLHSTQPGGAGGKAEFAEARVDVTVRR
ncbi:MAG: DUF4384 domain-containing protein [Desulfovibrionaceae bacterium]